MTYTPMTADHIVALCLDLSDHFERYAELVRRELWAESGEARNDFDYALGRIMQDARERGL